MDPVNQILKRYGVLGAWEPLLATGLANRIYATRDVILRVATDHPDGLTDARTESVAAPAAYAAGIRTPRMIAFDDSREIVDRPFSLWERVHAETLGLANLDRAASERVWFEAGRELARLHLRVTECEDPLGYLDPQGHESDLESLAGDMETMLLIEELRPYLDTHVPNRFLHSDLHPMNVMCTRDGELAALIDWGDAGWGDPALDFHGVPLELLPQAIAGYQSEAPTFLGPHAMARIAWDQLHEALKGVRDGERAGVPIRELRDLALY